MSETEEFDKKGVIKAIAVAAVVSLAGIGILGWQYQQIEKKRLPAIEQAIEEQKEAMEERVAQDVLRQFMSARIEQNEDRARLYLTERAMEQARLGELVLTDNPAYYEILDKDKLNEGEYRFMVEVYYEAVSSEPIEIITLIKLLNNYYIDSVEIAG